MQMQDLGPTLFLLSFIGVLVVPLPWNGKDEAAPAILPPPLAAPSTTLPEIPAAPKMPEPPVQVALAPEPAPEIKTGRRYSWKELECGALTGYGEARNKTHMHEAMAIKVLFNRAEETGQDICALAVRRDWDRRRRRWVNQFDGFWAVGCAPAFARGEVHFCEPGEKDAYARSRQLVQAVVEGKIELPPWNKRALFFTEHFDGFFKKLRARRSPADPHLTSSPFRAGSEKRILRTHKKKRREVFSLLSWHSSF